MKFFAIIGVVAFFLALYCGVVAGVAWLFQFLWNVAVVPTFHGPHLTYWVSVCIVGLLIIIGGFFKSTSSKN